jgi:AraC family transcriptional activator of pobA
MDRIAKSIVLFQVSMTGNVPNYFVYGEPDRPLDVGFMHVETVMERRHVHSGVVAAHQHERMAQITFWTRGSGVYFVEDTRYEFTAPAVSFIPSGTVHGFTVAPDDSDALVVSIANDALAPISALSALPFDKGLMVTDQTDNLVWKKLHAIMERLHDDYRHGISNTLSALIAVAATDIANLSNRETAKASKELQLAQAFRETVDAHYRENWPIDGYLQALSTTPHLLTKACRETFGLSVKAYIDERRLLEAKRLLLFTMRSVEDIGYELGFNDPAYFSRFFRVRIGQPPGEWRSAQSSK